MSNAILATAAKTGYHPGVAVHHRPKIGQPAGSPVEQAEYLKRAYCLAESAHLGQKRDSGEPYISHPLAVAEILADEFDDHRTIVLATALLHDVLENEREYLGESRAIWEEMGPEVLYLVQVLTKRKRIGDSREETLARYFQIVAEGGSRAMIVKLADRLHNLRTLRSCFPAKQVRIVAETKRFVYPLFSALRRYDGLTAERFKQKLTRAITEAETRLELAT